MAHIIDVAAHAKYFLRCLELLPAPYASLDTNRLTVAYFCVSGLDVLGSVARVDATRVIEWIYSLQVLPSSGGAEGAAPGRSAGFRGGSFMGGPFSAGGGPSSRRAKPIPNPDPDPNPNPDPGPHPHPHLNSGPGPHTDPNLEQ